MFIKYRYFILCKVDLFYTKFPYTLVPLNCQEFSQNITCNKQRYQPKPADTNFMSKPNLYSFVKNRNKTQNHVVLVYIKDVTKLFYKDIWLEIGIIPNSARVVEKKNGGIILAGSHTQNAFFLFGARAVYRRRMVNDIDTFVGSVGGISTHLRSGQLVEEPVY